MQDQLLKVTTLRGQNTYTDANARWEGYLSVPPPFQVRAASVEEAPMGNSDVRERSRGSHEQKLHDDLIEEGRRMPGVAEAIEVYETLQKHVPSVGLQQGVSTMGYATGGNS